MDQCARHAVHRHRLYAAGGSGGFLGPAGLVDVHRHDPFQHRRHRIDRVVLHQIYRTEKRLIGHFIAGCLARGAAR